MPACDDCNRGTSTADLIASSVARWNYNSDEVEIRDHRALLGRVRSRHPEVASEWSKPIDRAKARSHLMRYGMSVPIDAGLVTIGPQTIRYLNLFAHKVVLALYFERFRTPLSNEGRISALWRSKEDFTRGVPSELLGMMRDYGTLEQGDWNAHETFEYRFSENKKDGLFMCLGKFRKGFYTAGFATVDATHLPSDALDFEEINS
jgi:hypothetical protein